MNKLKLYPISEIKIKDKYSPYKRYESIPGGKRIILNVPNKYLIELDCYNLIPGLSIIFSNSNLKDWYRNINDILHFVNKKENLFINYYIEGQCQVEISPDKYIFLKENDINLYIKRYNPNFNILGEIKLLHIIINKNQLKDAVLDYNKEYYEIFEKLFDKSLKEKNIVFKSPEKISNLVNELLTFKPTNELSNRIFYQIKTLEILLNLYEIDFQDEKISQRTYSDATIRVVRYIKNSLSRNIASYVTLETLSMSYGINLTTLKNCFKDMYGKPLYTWYKEYKFYRARELIKNTDYPIAKIANMVGYKSSSKFAKAFKKEMGVLPSSYRKNK